MHAAVGHERLEGLAGDGPADGVEAGHGDHARRVVDEDVHARGPLQGPDVAALAPDDAPLHVVRGDPHRADRRVDDVLGRVPLDGLEGDLAAPLAGLGLGLLQHLLAEQVGLVLALVADLGEELLAGLLLGEAGDVPQPLPHLDAGLVDLLAGDLQLALQPLGLALAAVQLRLPLADLLKLAVEVVLPLGQAGLVLADLGDGLGDLPVEGLAALAGLLLGLQLDPLLGGVGLGGGGPLDLLGLPAGPADAVAGDHAEQHPAQQEAAHDPGDGGQGAFEWCQG